MPTRDNWMFWTIYSNGLPAPGPVAPWTVEKDSSLNRSDRAGLFEKQTKALTVGVIFGCYLEFWTAARADEADMANYEYATPFAYPSVYPSISLPPASHLDFYVARSW